MVPGRKQATETAMRRLALLFLGCLLVALAFVGYPLGGKPRAQDTLRAAAMVNDEVISVLDLVMRTRLAILASGLKNSAEVRDRLREQVLRSLIDERLQVQEADRLDISVEESQLETEIAGLAQRNNMNPDQFLQLLAKNQILPTALRDQIRSEITWQTLVQVRLRPSIEISEEEVDEFIGRFESRSGSVQLRVSEILLSVDSADQEQQIREAANRLTEELRNGASFAELARQFSQSATASVAGDLGWVQEAQLPDELDQALAQMQPGQVRGPIRTFGKRIRCRRKFI
jgi:peptidyl-prolyl cis-trans isomerase SurA